MSIFRAYWRFLTFKNNLVGFCMHILQNLESCFFLTSLESYRESWLPVFRRGKPFIKSHQMHLRVGELKRATESCGSQDGGVAAVVLIELGHVFNRGKLFIKDHQNHLRLRVGELRVKKRSTESCGSQGGGVAAAVQVAAVLSAATLTVVRRQPASRDKVTASSVFSDILSSAPIKPWHSHLSPAFMLF